MLKKSVVLKKSIAFWTSCLAGKAGIRHNAVSGKWNLAENFMDYTYSSARYCELGEPGDVEVNHYLDVLDISEFPADNSEGL